MKRKIKKWQIKNCPPERKESLLKISGMEKALILGKSVAIVCVINYFFYRSVWAVLPLCLIGVMYYRMEREALIIKKKEETKEQFKELMLLVSTGQKAGYSAENAFLSAYQDMKVLYGEESNICKMLCILRTGRENNIDFSVLWHQMGSEMEIPELQEFASVYEISGKSSGNMAAVMEKTAGIIVRKMETEKEIEVLLSARKLEQKIMNSMPFLIMLYINITSPGYFGRLYHSFFGVAVMTLCLAIYLVAYMLARKIAFVEL